MYACMYVCMYACIEQQHLRDEVGAWQNNRKHRLSRRLLVSEAQIDNRHMSTVNCNSTSKDHDIAAWWTCQATAASAVIELPLKASNRRIAATDCTETVLICHERDLFFCRSHGRVQALDLRTARQSMQAKASSFGYKRYILHTESGSSPRHGNSHIEHHGHLRTTADGHKVQKVSSSCTSAIHSQAAYGNDTSAADSHAARSMPRSPTAVSN